MPKQCQFWPARPAPIQLPIFAEEASLIRVCPERNEFRYYRMAVWPDLFGRALLARHWGRLGTQGRIRLDPHPDPGARSTPSTGSPGKSAAAATRTARCEPAGRVSKGKSEGFALAHPPGCRAPWTPRPKCPHPSPPPPPGGMWLHTADGARKYLTADCVDLSAGLLVIESLKKRRRGIYRAVPVPRLCSTPSTWCTASASARPLRGKGRGEPLWPRSRMTDWRAIHAIMAVTELDGPHQRVRKAAAMVGQQPTNKVA